MQPVTANSPPPNGVQHALPALARMAVAAATAPFKGSQLSADSAAAYPAANYSLRGLRSTETMGALDDSPAPVGQIFQEELCMQRLLVLLTHEIRWLRRSGARELELMLRPDPETKIALHVVWNQGRFNAEARCHEGDFHLIHARWDELQYQLAPQGLHLGPLLPPPVRVEYGSAPVIPPSRALPAPALTA